MGSDLLLLWEYHNSSGDHYELKAAGHSIRLYRNRIFHSQCNRSRLANGGVWDLLWLPVFFMQAAEARRILLLGVGLGAALQKLHWLLPNAEIVAVDIDPVHVRLARMMLDSGTHIGIDEAVQKLPARMSAAKSPVYSRDRRVELHCADAIDWLQRYRGSSFDVIIDDLFIDGSSESPTDPRRVVELTESISGSMLNRFRLPQRHSWMALLHKRLGQSGLLVANCAAKEQTRPAAKLWLSRAFQGYSWSTHSSEQPRSSCVLTTTNYENRVLVLGRDYIGKPHTHCIDSGGSWLWSRKRLEQSLSRQLETLDSESQMGAGASLRQLMAPVRIHRLAEKRIAVPAE